MTATSTAPISSMTSPGNCPQSTISACGEDPEWVADLVDTMREGDLDITVDILEGLVRRLRKASKARQALARVPASTLRSALELRARDTQSGPRG